MQDNGSETYVLVLDDHPMVAESLVASVRAHRARIKICVAESLEMALQFIASLGAPVLILSDLSLTDVAGLGVMRELRSAAPQATLLVVTANEDPGMRLQAQQFGVAGYFLKSTSVDALREAIAEALLPFADTLQAADVRDDPLGSRLTRAQIGVLVEMAAGRSNKEIAIRLGVSGETVTSHVKEILRRLNVRNRTQAVVRYMELDAAGHGVQGN